MVGVLDLGIDGFDWTRTLGGGGFATVHAAHDEEHGREVAVKVLHAQADDATRRRFDRERRAMGALASHPNIVTVLTSGYTADQRPYLVMELVEGGSLADALLGVPRSWAEVESIALPLLDAVEAGHNANVIHRDIKPANVLITPDGRPMLSDFGIAVVANDETLQQTVSATPAYAAPELLQGREVDERSDVYSLAATIFALLEGKQPYGASTDGVLTVLSQIADAPVPDLSDGSVPDSVKMALKQAMAKRPEDRPQNIAEFRERLLGEAPAVVPVAPVTSVAPGVDSDPAKTEGGSRAPIFVGVAALVLAGVLGVAAFTFSNREGAIAIPDVAGQSVLDARLALADAGFVVPPTPACDTALVRGTQPPTGEEAVAGSEVDLDFDPCIAPDFVGLVLDEAIDIAVNTNGIMISWPNFCDDTILGQSPAAGSVIEFDQSINLELTPCAN